MQESNNSNALHWILGAALLLIGLFVVIALVSVKSQADNVTSTASINNAAPSVTAITINSDATFTPNAGADKDIVVTGTVSDPNTNADGSFDSGLASLSLTLYRSGNSASCQPTYTGGNSDATTDGNDCYHAEWSFATPGTTCTMTPGASTALTADFSCTIPVKYWADATDDNSAFAAQNWKASAIVLDTHGANSASVFESASGIEFASVNSLVIDSAIPYGALAVGEATTNSTNPNPVVLTQNGNDAASVDVSAPTGNGSSPANNAFGSMVCTGGDIPASSQQWSLEDVGYDGSGTHALTTTGVATGVNVAVRTDETTANTMPLFWNIQIPSSGVYGTCTGTVLVTTTAY